MGRRVSFTRVEAVQNRGFSRIFRGSGSRSRLKEQRPDTVTSVCFDPKDLAESRAKIQKPEPVREPVSVPVFATEELPVQTIGTARVAAEDSVALPHFSRSDSTMMKSVDRRPHRRSKKKWNR